MLTGMFWAETDRGWAVYREKRWSPAEPSSEEFLAPSAGA